MVRDERGDILWIFRKFALEEIIFLKLITFDNVKFRYAFLTIQI